MGFSRCTILLLLALLFALPSHAVVAEHGHKHPVEPSSGAGKGEVGLTERLGGKVPLDVVLRDEAGRPVRLGDLLTGPTLVLPVYYGCTNVCNYLQWGVAGVLPAIAAQPGKDYRVLSVSFDETDTPERASHARRMYLDAMKMPFPQDGWRFLTGDGATVKRLTDAAGYHFRREGRDFVHPVASFVITRDGMIVRYLYGTAILPKDLALAITEAREGKSGATIRKVVNYCFSFNPASKSYELNLLRISATVIALSTLSFMAYLFLGDRKRRTRKEQLHPETGEHLPKA